MVVVVSKDCPVASWVPPACWALRCNVSAKLRAVAAGHSVVVHYTGKEDVDTALQSIRAAGSEAGAGSLEAVAGRPAFTERLQHISEGSKADGTVARSIGVLACGPQKMVDGVKVSCIAAEKPGCHFDYHAEVFEW